MNKIDLEQKLEKHNQEVNTVLSEYCDITKEQVISRKYDSHTIGFKLKRALTPTIPIEDFDNISEEEQKEIDLALQSDLKFIGDTLVSCVLQEEESFFDRLHNNLYLPIRAFNNKKEFKTLKEGIDTFYNPKETESIIWISNDLVEETVSLKEFFYFVVPELLEFGMEPHEDLMLENAKTTLRPIGTIYGVQVRRKDILPNKTFALVDKGTPGDRPFAARTRATNYEPLLGLYYSEEKQKFVRDMGISPKGLDKVSVGIIKD